MENLFSKEFVFLRAAAPRREFLFSGLFVRVAGAVGVHPVGPGGFVQQRVPGMHKVGESPAAHGARTEKDGFARVHADAYFQACELPFTEQTHPGLVQGCPGAPGVVRPQKSQSQRIAALCGRRGDRDGFSPLFQGGRGRLSGDVGRNLFNVLGRARHGRKTFAGASGGNDPRHPESNPCL